MKGLVKKVAALIFFPNFENFFVFSSVRSIPLGFLNSGST